MPGLVKYFLRFFLSFLYNPIELGNAFKLVINLLSMQLVNARVVGRPKEIEIPVPLTINKVLDLTISPNNDNIVVINIKLKENNLNHKGDALESISSSFFSFGFIFFNQIIFSKS